MAFDDLLERTDLAARQHLGGAVSYTTGDGNATVSVRGIFDAAYVLVDVGQAGVSSCGPAVFLRLEDLPADPTGSDDPTIGVAGVSYKVREARPDGMGGVVLLLHAV